MSQPQYVAFPPISPTLRGGLFHIGIEKFADIYPEMEPLWTKHWAMVELGKTPLILSVAIDEYIAQEKAGHLVLYTVRDAQLQLVGYLVTLMYRSMHANGDLMAREDTMYVDDSARGGGAGNALMNYAEDAFRRFGCAIFLVTSRHPSGGTDMTSWLMKRGFEPVAVTFKKDLKS